MNYEFHNLLAGRWDCATLINKFTGDKISMTYQPPPVATNILCAAEMLEGVDLGNGWKVTTKVPVNTGSTGGSFSVSYFVEKEERQSVHKAFLKALNFRSLATAPDFARAVQQQTAAFNFERDTFKLCNNKGLKRVAKILEAGEYRDIKCPWPVCYIIFELADGDLRKQISKLAKFDLAWTLRTLHHIVVGLNQLHIHGIAHQDLKPSNVLFFNAFGAKIGDLGCADTELEPSQSPRGKLGIAGDPSYAPPELFYSEFSTDWKQRRLGCDLYLLGSLVVFFFTGGASMTALWQEKLIQAHKPLTWRQDYRLVLPYVRDAFENALEGIKTSIPEEVRPEIISIIRYLCEPDPKLRGHPTDLGRSQFNLERVISIFNLLATKAEFDLLKISK